MSTTKKQIKIWLFNQERYLYLLTAILISYWIFEAVEWYQYSLTRFGEGRILYDEMTQLHLFYSIGPAIYAFSKSDYVKSHRAIFFLIKIYFGTILILAAIACAAISFFIMEGV